MFLLCALLLVVIQHLIISGRSQGSPLSPLPVLAREGGEDEVRQLLRHAAEQPTSDIYTRLSACYEKRGEYRRALMYLRKAEAAREIEDAAE